MSKLSLYETKWTDLVFENKNKEYGAYQLRQETSKNSFAALFMALLIIATIGSVSALVSKFSGTDVVPSPPEAFTEPITPVDLTPRIEQPRTEEPIQQQQQAAATSSETDQLVNPEIVSTEQAITEIATNTNNVPVSDNTSATGTTGVTNVLPSTGGGEALLPAAPTNDPVAPGVLDKMPEFPGGMSKFYTYVGNNFNRPELDAERTLKVYVTFVIEKDGSITDVMVKNDPGYGIGKEAIRVLKSIKTKWSPGILNGKAVRTLYSLPITIKTEAE
ncbi:energy transducer TonB [Flavobacterium sp. Fl-77]|uniref:Energy transducer TonB n=1 Tax=Flavobacterium flavipigmentatum TaxID=2893884 RepID=A0AAJ2VY00_9FLAO|nr:MULTISPECIES: energy transducer TonB [unclassified Flavobacterium]MDX6182313.1 energy transducer TonB [Flavobacterium sp. Fl-33]MDX6185774.1 energy transducer TonB [Flavobacterium sp. Fl-77]UFH38954.1 energy transducer TonB [Flavobacterium sp. F-70]